jgi:hypothetical protein
LFTIKENLVFMNNLYHKVAVASVCTALGFVLGTNKEAKAATFNSSFNDPVITFHAYDGGSFGSFDGLGDAVDSVTDPDVGYRDHSWSVVERTTASEIAALTEFSIPDFTYSITGSRTDTKITNIISAVFRVEVQWWLGDDNPQTLGLFGYVGNGTAEASDLEAGIFLGSYTGSTATLFAEFNVTPFLNGLVSNNNEFAGFAVRSLTENRTFMREVGRSFQRPPTLFVEGEYETVPEPITIFGSAMGLCLGGWLKRKKLSQQNKTVPQR